MTTVLMLRVLTPKRSLLLRKEIKTPFVFHNGQAVCSGDLTHTVDEVVYYIDKEQQVVIFHWEPFEEHEVALFLSDQGWQIQSEDALNPEMHPAHDQLGVLREMVAEVHQNGIEELDEDIIDDVLEWSLAEITRLRAKLRVLDPVPLPPYTQN